MDSLVHLTAKREIATAIYLAPVYSPEEPLQLKFRESGRRNNLGVLLCHPVGKMNPG